MQKWGELAADRLCDNRQALKLNNGVTLLLLACEFGEQKLDEPGELRLIEYHGKATHGITCTLAKTELRATSQLNVDSVHQLIFVDEIGLAQDDQAESLEDLSADVEALFLYLRSTSILNTAKQMRRYSRDESCGIRFAAICDDTTYSQRKNIERFELLGRCDIGDELVDNRGEVVLANLGGDALNALNSVRFDLHVRVVELLDESRTDAPLKALFNLIGRLGDLVTKIIGTGEPDIIVEVLAVFEHLGKVGGIASMLSGSSSSVGHVELFVVVVFLVKQPRRELLIILTNTWFVHAFYS